jgi:hypothetical protein
LAGFEVTTEVAMIDSTVSAMGLSDALGGNVLGGNEFLKQRSHSAVRAQPATGGSLRTRMSSLVLRMTASY